MVCYCYSAVDDLIPQWTQISVSSSSTVPTRVTGLRNDANGLAYTLLPLQSEEFPCYPADVFSRLLDRFPSST